MINCNYLECHCDGTISIKSRGSTLFWLRSNMTNYKGVFFPLALSSKNTLVCLFMLYCDRSRCVKWLRNLVIFIGLEFSDFVLQFHALSNTRSTWGFELQCTWDGMFILQVASHWGIKYHVISNLLPSMVNCSHI